MKTPTSNVTLSFLFALATLAACQKASDPSSDSDPAASQIEQTNGALTMDDEEPDFGDSEAFAELTAEEGEVDVEDPMESDPETVELRDLSDAVLFHSMIRWGQFPLNLDLEEATSWSGRLSVNRGAIIVRQTLAFDEGDTVLPREDRTYVDFKSQTLPHHDGLRLTIVDPTPLAEEPLTLTYTRQAGELDAATQIFEVNVADLVADASELYSDELGNRVIAAALAEARDACAHGFLHGRWKKLEEGRGVLRGFVRGPRGAVLGVMRGFYGVRENGEKVFFGKYINRLGRFRGLFVGTYEAGHFRGRWIVRAGVIGGLRGVYRENPETDGVTGGGFVGRWAEASCDEGGDEEEAPSDS